MIQVAIRSAGRPNMCAERSYAMLRAGGFHPDQITVFVPNPVQRAEYIAALEAHAHAGAQVVIAPHDPTYKGTADIGTEPRGMGLATRHIFRHYAPGTQLVLLDDDLQRVAYANDPKTLHPLDRLTEYCADMFTALKIASNCTMWGIYPVANPYFMQPTWSYGLVFCPGPFRGIIVSHNDPCMLDDKDDYELCLHRYTQGQAMLRDNATTVDAGYRSTPGGCQTSRTLERAELMVRYLEQTYPGLVKRIKPRKDGWPEVKLNGPKPLKL